MTYQKPAKIYGDALRELRELTNTPPAHGTVTLLIRAAIMSEAAGAFLAKAELHTKAQRRDAIVATAFLIAHETDERALEARSPAKLKQINV